jgi:hypothetical protein
MQQDLKYLGQYLRFKGVDEQDPSAVLSHLTDLTALIVLHEGIDVEDFKAAVHEAIDSRVSRGAPLRFELTAATVEATPDVAQADKGS